MDKLIIRGMAALAFSAALLAPPITAPAGELEPPAGPAALGSAMFSTDAIWNRLQEGDDGVKRNGAEAFVGPLAGPDPNVSVGKSLDEIMAVAPAVDNDHGAAPVDVLPGKTYWSLRDDGLWGLQRSPWAPLPKSGQTMCYDAVGTPTSCEGTGQDGALQKGVALPTPRFAGNSNGTVTDNLTGLTWLTDANCVDLSPKTWTAALTAVAGLKGDGSMCGLSDDSVAGDWRLPNAKELFSLVSHAYSAPALSNTDGSARWTAGAPFSSVQLSPYWSSTSKWGGSAWNYAAFVNFGYGTLDSEAKAVSWYVWPVRGGQ